MLSFPIEITRKEQDLDNDIWIIDFVSEEKKIRGKADLPRKVISLENITELTVDIIPSSEEPPKYNDLKIQLNTKIVRLKQTDPLVKTTKQFSAGGLGFRIVCETGFDDFPQGVNDFIISFH